MLTRLLVFVNICNIAFDCNAITIENVVVKIWKIAGNSKLMIGKNPKDWGNLSDLSIFLENAVHDMKSWRRA